MEAETRAPRSRFVFWLVVLVLAVGLLLAAAHRLGLLGRGTDYYFPRWTWGNTASDEELDKRRRDLDDVSVGLPMLLRIFEAKPSKIGARWESMKSRLPYKLESYLPRYADSGKFPAAQWLAWHSTNAEVLHAVQTRWPKWGEEEQKGFLFVMFSSRIPMFPAFSPILLPALGSTNETLAMAAAEVTSRAKLIPDDAQLALATFVNICAVQGTSSQTYQWANVSKNVAGHVSLSPAVLAAFEKMLTSGHPSRATLAAFVLGSISPDRFPPETVFKPLFLKLPGGEQDAILSSLSFQNRVGRDLAGTEFYRDFLVEMLPSPATANSSKAVRARTILNSLAQSGARSAAHGRALEPWIAPTNTLFGEALPAYLEIAPLTTEAATPLLPLLALRSSCAEVLLWFAGAGTNVSSLQDDIAKIAADTRLVLNDMNAAGQRNTISRAAVAPGDGTISLPMVAPSLVKIRPLEVKQRNLLRQWPGFPAGTNVGRWLYSGPTPVPKSVQDLAKHALSRMHGEVRAEKETMEPGR